MATTSMTTDKEKATWETKLQEAGYVIRTIRTQNDGMMEAIFNLLELAQDDYPKQTQLLDFIDGHQGLKAGAVDQQHGEPRKKAKISCLDVMKSSPLDVRPPPTPGSDDFYLLSHACKNDVILVASEKKKITGKLGYQCKEGKNETTQGVEQEFDSSFVLKGLSPVDSSHKVSWIIH